MTMGEGGEGGIGYPDHEPSIPPLPGWGYYYMRNLPCGNFGHHLIQSGALMDTLLRFPKISESMYKQ